MFARLGRLVRGFLSLFISGIEEANPEALMEAARQDFRQKMMQYNLALAKMAGVAERLKAQVKGKAVRAQDLERRILANHSAGNLELALTGALKRGAGVAVLLANLDSFRSVNDSFGYEAGDRLLLALAERLENTVGLRGTVAHFGGDQFAVLLEDVASVGVAVRVARRIEEGLRSPLDLGRLERAVTTSIGVGLSTPQWEPPGEIVRRADAAMYRAKEAGKGRAGIEDPGADEGASA